MIRQILDDCQPGFAEVVLMLANNGSTAEIYTMFEDLRFTDDGTIVTFMAEGGTHVHMHMDEVKEVKFIHTTNQQGLPSYSLWLMSQADEPLVYGPGGTAHAAGLPAEVREGRDQPAAAQPLHGPD